MSTLEPESDISLSAHASTDRPPAVVVGIDTPIGLTIVRDLGATGVQVYGLGRPRALGMASRHLYQGIERAPDGAGLIRQLTELSERLENACLFVVSENDIALINACRAQLHRYRFMFPDRDRMDSVLNKNLTYAAAARAGIRVPRTEQISEFAHLESVCSNLRFPVVLKWANPHLVAKTLAASNLTLEKVRYCHSPQELIEYLRPFEKTGLFPLIQEYCAGYGLGHFILMKNGTAHYTFQHLRVHEWPPEGGFSSMCESLPQEVHQELMQDSINLLRELSWEGVAMVEYRHDPATGESALMEVNGRFWGSLPLAYHAGARFPRMMYLLFGCDLDIHPKPYQSRLRCRYMLPETKRLLRILFAQDKIADKELSFNRGAEVFNYLIGFIDPRTRYYVMTLDDPSPFLHDIRQMMRKAWQIFKDKTFQVSRKPSSTTGN